MINTHTYLIKVRVSYFPISAAAADTRRERALISVTGNQQRAKSVTHELKLLCGMWEPCTDPPTFVLRQRHYKGGDKSLSGK